MWGSVSKPTNIFCIFWVLPKVQWLYRITLTLITYGFLFHFMLVGVTDDQKSQTCHSEVLGKFFYDTLKTRRQLRH